MNQSPTQEPPMSENEKLREALAYEQGCRDTWDAVRGTNADMRPDASAAYITCVQAAKTTLEKATLARAAHQMGGEKP